MRRATWFVASVCAIATLAGFDSQSAVAVLYSESFDVNHSANWKTNVSPFGTSAANFFFDYSTVGIPSAPNSVGGTTRGLKLSANLVPSPLAGPNPGVSVSPLGQSFSGNYEVKFDWWSNYVGPLGASPAGSTQLSTFGILTSGNVANYAGASDGLFFAASANGGVAPDAQPYGDYSAYSVERVDGYQFPLEDQEDAHAYYFALSRDADEYTSVFPGGKTAPILQQSNFPATQTGVTPAGTPGFAWHQVEIEKIGTNVFWRVDGEPMVYVNTASFESMVGGGNIFFGHSDIDRIASPSPNFATLQFTLIDNVRVLSLAGDYNLDGNVDAADYSIWKQQYGAVGANNADGNGDGRVDAVDYTVWRNSVTPIGLGGAGGLPIAIPEPSTLVLAGSCLAVAILRQRRRAG